MAENGLNFPPRQTPGEETLVCLKTMDEKEYLMLIKHCFLRRKMLFKHSNSLINVIQTLLHQQQLRDNMLTLNAVTQVK